MNPHLVSGPNKLAPLLVGSIRGYQDNTTQGVVIHYSSVVPPATGVKMWSSGQGAFLAWSSGQGSKIRGSSQGQNSFLRPVIEGPSKSSPQS